MYKENLDHGIKILNLNDHGIIWVNLKQHVFGLDKDIILGVVYIPPDGSIIHSDMESDFFTVLDNDIIYFRR